MSASLFAGCSGGTSGVLGSGTAAAGSAAIRIDAGGLGSLSSSRAPQFVGTNVNTVAYVFSPGNITGSVALNTCPALGTPPTYTCTISVPPNVYALTITLKQGAVAVGSGSATGVTVLPSQTTPVAVTVTPVNQGPALSVPAGSQFYVDGHTQTITSTANELDPVGDVITTYYGPVSNYPTLTFSGTNATGVTFNGGNTITVVPAAQAGGTAPIAYNGSGANASSLVAKLSDGNVATAVTVTIPYLSLAYSASPVQLTASGSQAFTVTENATAGGTATYDTTFNAATTCGTHVTFNPALLAQFNALTAHALTVNATAVDSGITSCTVTLTSAQDTNLSTTVTLLLPSGLGIGVH
jgi:hypothetical protein